MKIEFEARFRDVDSDTLTDLIREASSDLNGRARTTPTGESEA